MKPAVYLGGFHRVGQIDHYLMDVVANRAFERPDVKAGKAVRDSRQHGRRCARRTGRLRNMEHGASPWIRRERYRTLSHRDAVQGAGGGSQHPPLNPGKLINAAHLSKSLTSRLARLDLLVLLDLRLFPQDRV
jgi:hypothetical protein